MRKSGWTAAAGLGLLVLLLAACGGSGSSNAAAGSPSSSATQSTATSPSSAATSPASTGTAKATQKATPGSSTSAPATHPPAQPQASSNAGVSFPPIGTTVMIVQKTAIGYVLAEASELVVYTYAKDTKGGPPTCTGSCAAVWLPVTGVPKAGPADTFPGTFGLVTRADGVKQITYKGYPLYLLKGAKKFSTAGNGAGGVWHVVMLSASDITA